MRNRPVPQVPLSFRYLSKSFFSFSFLGFFSVLLCHCCSSRKFFFFIFVCPWVLLFFLIVWKRLFFRPAVAARREFDGSPQVTTDIPWQMTDLFLGGKDKKRLYFFSLSSSCFLVYFSSNFRGQSKGTIGAQVDTIKGRVMFPLKQVDCQKLFPNFFVL